MVESLNRQMSLLGFQDERQIDAFAFRNVETADCEKSPALRWVRKHFACQSRWQNDKTWVGCAHEFCSMTFLQGCEKTLNSGAKIPNQRWLLEFDRSKLHVRPQRRSGNFKELIRGEESSHHWRNHEGDQHPNTRSCGCDPRKRRTVAFICCCTLPVACQQKCKQRKGRQCVVG